jgi:hypothetical protein
MQLYKFNLFESGVYSVILPSSKKRLIQKTSSQFAYGHREILLDYIGIPYSNVIKGILQHGVGPAEMLDRKTPRYGVKRLDHYVYSELIVRQQVQNNWQVGIPIGAPWIYLCKMLESNQKGFGATENTGGIIVFPHHTDLSMQTEENIEIIRKRIDYWRTLASDKPLTICLYHSEFLNMTWHSLAEDAGVTLWCNGVGSTPLPWSLHTGRKHFLNRLYEILNQNESVIVEEFTSAMFYAGYLRKRVFFAPGNFSRSHQRYPKSQQSQNKALTKSNAVIERVIQEFGMKEGQFLDDSTFFEMCDQLLGKRELLTPSALREKIKFVEFPELVV